ncbi:hypothetical protein BH10ACI1_BH10ACI1_09990 [soil metagenome]
MKEITLQTSSIIEVEKKECEINQKRLHRWNYALFVSMSVGIASGLTGLILGTISYLVTFRNAKAVNYTGNLLLFTAFPLMFVGAHALDKIREIKKQSKIASSNTNY